MRLHPFAIAGFSLLGALLIGCSAGEGGGSEPDADQDGSGSTGSSGLKVGGEDCPAPCSEGEFCGAKGVCLPLGSCQVQEDCEEGKTCQDGSCIIGGECGAEEFGLTVVDPNVLVVLDRSCSMSTGTNGRWPQAVAALKGLASDFDDKIRFGLELFPDGVDKEDFFAECTVDPSVALAVPLASGGGTQMSTLLDEISADVDHAFYPGNGPCQTNTHAALQTASELESLRDPTRDSYVLLVTDGEATCKGSSDDQREKHPQLGDIPQINEVLEGMAADGIQTFVVGFGGDVSADDLNSHALAGGTALEGEQAYFQADSEAELSTAMNSILGTIVSCQYTLDDAPPNAEELYVFINDDEKLERGDADGWDLDMETLTLEFKGEACRKLKDGEIEDVDVVFGCAAPVLR